MRSFLKNNSAVFIIYLLALATALYYLELYSKITIHLYMNGYVGNPVLNFIFYYVTYLGDGAVAAFLLLGILLYNVRLGIYCTASFLTASLCSIGLKEIFFDDVDRPSFILKFIEPHPFTQVEGVELYIHNSFPSGHSTQAFSIFMCLVLVSSNQLLKLLFFGLALLTALSRVYLSQHWLADITAGSVIGTLFACTYYYFIIGRNSLQKLNKPLSDLKRL